MLSVSINSASVILDKQEKKILDKFSFKLERGNIYTIQGKNGSGKSTLINTLTYLTDKSSFKIDAAIEFNGRNLLKLSEDELIQIKKEKIKYVFQDSVNSFDALKTFEYYFRLLDGAENEISDLLDYFLLPARDQLFKLHPYEVSGGMAQRISICLAILKKPELIILDEPTSAIDINISNLLCNKLKGLAHEHGSCILIITQDEEFAHHVSDYTAQMCNGTLSQFIRVSTK